MLSLKLFELYGDLLVKTDKFEAQLKQLEAQTASFGKKVIQVKLSIPTPKRFDAFLDRLTKLIAHFQQPVNFNFVLNASRINAAFNSINTAINQYRTGVKIPITADIKSFMTDISKVEARLRLVQTMGVIRIRGLSQVLKDLNDVLKQLKQINARVTINNNNSTNFRNPNFGVINNPPRPLPPPAPPVSQAARFGSGFVQGLGTGLYGPPAQIAGQVAGRATATLTTDSVKTAIDLQAKMAEIRRVAGLSADETFRLKENLKDAGVALSGVSLNDLLEIANVGGRSGVKGGQLSDFVKDVALVKNAVADMDTETLATDMNKVLNVFGKGPEYIRGFGSALTAMDNVSQATAKDILDITQRLSGTGAAIGLTIPQLTALASVLKDVGLSNEVAGSSFSQIFRRMGSETEKFATVIGVSAKEFARAYRQDPMDALKMVIDRFHELGGTIENQEFMAELGLKGVRAAAAFQQLAAKFDLVSERSKVASNETRTLSALMEANAIKGETASAAILKFENAWQKLSDTLASTALPTITAMTEQLTKLIEAGTWVANHFGPSATLGRVAAARGNQGFQVAATPTQAELDASMKRAQAQAGFPASKTANKQGTPPWVDRTDEPRGAFAKLFTLMGNISRPGAAIDALKMAGAWVARDARGMVAGGNRKGNNGERQGEGFHKPFESKTTSTINDVLRDALFDNTLQKQQVDWLTRIAETAQRIEANLKAGVGGAAGLILKGPE